MHWWLSLTLALAVPPSGGDKALHGSVAGQVHQTENFAVLYDEGVTVEEAEALGAELELAWQALIVRDGWPAPTASETFLVWVIADPFVDGGGDVRVTTSDAYPDGYPVLYLAPEADDAAREAEAAHQLMHAIQLRLMPIEEWEGENGWFWESTAVWAENVVAADNFESFPLAAGYLEQAWMDHTSSDLDRAAGLFLFNRWIEELSPGVVQRAWIANAASPGAWTPVIAPMVGEDDGVLWARFNGTLAVRGLGGNFGLPTVTAEATTGAASWLSYLATEFYQYEGAVPARIEAAPLLTGQDILIAHDDQVGTEVVVEPSAIVAVTGVTEGGANFQLLVYDVEDTGWQDPDGGVPSDARQSQRIVTTSCSHAPGLGFAWLGLAVLGLRRRS